MTAEQKCVWAELYLETVEVTSCGSPSHTHKISLWSPCASIALPSGVDHKPKGCLGLLEGMYTNLLLQTQLAKQQMAILENLQASVTRLGPGKESKKPPGPILQPIVKSPAPVQ